MIVRNQHIDRMQYRHNEPMIVYRTIYGIAYDHWLTAYCNTYCNICKYMYSPPYVSPMTYMGEKQVYMGGNIVLHAIRSYAIRSYAIRSYAIRSYAIRSYAIRSYAIRFIHGRKTGRHT